MGAVEIPPPHRPVRSFHPRRGRIGPGRRSLLTDDLPAYLLDRGQLDGRQLPGGDVVLEVGCGDGAAAVAFAAAHPATTVIACDVHTPGIATLVGRLRDAAIGNVRVHVGDALDVLERSPDGWLSGVHVFFPDPWPKVRHERRRLVQPWFASLCARVLQPGGLLHLATDVEAYATRAERTLASEARFERCPAPCRAETRYERKGRAAGRPAIDLAWRRLPDA